MVRHAAVLLTVAIAAMAMWAAIALAAAPVASFSFFPADPSIADTVQFTDTSTSTAPVESWMWDFGDGATSTAKSPTHQYAADGDYTVHLTVTSSDGSSETTQAIPVRSHDVGVTRLAAPKSAKVGQTTSITVSVRTFRYSENVQVQLLARPAGDDFRTVGTVIQAVPLRSGKRTTGFTFDYTFLPADGGTLTFRAVATTLNVRDYVWSNNEVLAAPTNVR